MKAMDRAFAKVGPVRGGRFFAWVLDGASPDERPPCPVRYPARCSPSSPGCSVAAIGRTSRRSGVVKPQSSRTAPGRRRQDDSQPVHKGVCTAGREDWAGNPEVTGSNPVPLPVRRTSEDRSRGPGLLACTDAPGSAYAAVTSVPRGSGAATPVPGSTGPPGQPRQPAGRRRCRRRPDAAARSRHRPGPGSRSRRVRRRNPAAWPRVPAAP